MFTQSIRATRTAIAIGVALALIACSGESPKASRGRVLLIGIDGASPRIVDPLLAEGRLPNLAQIAREGVHGKLRSEMPLHSPRIWNTIVTGVSPEKHGIVTFSFGGRDGRQHLYTSRHRRARALWTIASAAGLKVAVVNLWNTYPLEKINGVMVSDHILATQIDERERLTGAAKARVGDVIYPPAWNERLSGMIEARMTPVPDFASPFDESRALPRWVLRDELQRRFEEDGALAQMTLEILREERPDVTLVLLPGVDRISHYLWGVIEPPDVYSEGLVPTEEGRAGGKAALYRYYEYVDALVGHLAADFGPNDLVMVLSDHGFEAHEAMMRLTGNHHTEEALDGIVYASGAGLPVGEEITGLGVKDIAPTLLRWLHLPVARDMDGSAASLLADPGVAPVPSYDDIAVEFVTPEDTQSGAEEEVIERLKALGYIESE